MGAIAELLVDADGAPRVAPEVLADALAWLLLGVAAGPGASELPPLAAAHLGAFAQRAGVDGAVDDGAARLAVERYFAAHPLPQELRVGLEQAIRVTAAETGALGNELASVIGSAAARGALERTAPPPSGTVAAGPMARFAVRDLKK
ncbi:MAG: hypothetical protein IT382_04350 [Deltaproteobacteria bacterium]|nr:hypothetical protein [Deltaproteobacteria bacterium]